MVKGVAAGALYFALVFATGFLFGIVRVLWAEPRLGVRVAELAEMPLMLVVIILAAGWTMNRLAVPTTVGVRVASGAVALGLLLGAEAMLVLAMQGLTLADYVATRDPLSGGAYLIMLVVYALMPLGLRHRRHPRT